MSTDHTLGAGPPAAMDESLLSAYVDGELDAETRTAVEVQLEGSAEWRAVLAEVSEARDAIRGLPVHDAPAGFWDRMLRDTEPASSSSTVVDLDAARRRRRPHTARWVAVAAAAAAAAIIAIAVVPRASTVRPAVATFRDAHAVRSSVGNDAVSTLAGAVVPEGLTR